MMFYLLSSITLEYLISYIYKIYLGGKTNDKRGLKK